jgi:hypothetical protein
VPGVTIERIGFLETADGWAHATGVDKLGRAIDVVVDVRNPDGDSPMVHVRIDGERQNGVAVPSPRIRIR